MLTAAILPIKRFGAAKRRLRAHMDGREVEALVASMFSDVLQAVTDTAGIDQLIVVTPDPRAAQLARQLGAGVLEDDEKGHNSAAANGVRHAITGGATRALLVPGDCPLLDPTELEELLARETEPPSVLVIPDRHKSGTNALLLDPPDAIDPSFGPDSCVRHQQLAQASGASCEVVEVPSLALDVDTPEDLAAVTSSRC
jgi:2-phospho-L-lactate guanylyltransferase